MDNGKKLYKDVSRKKLTGVLAGFSDYINADVTLVRIFYVLLCLKLHVFGIIVYIISAIIMPDKSEVMNNQTDHDEH